MTDEEKEFIKKVNIDKAKNKTFVAIGLIAISLLSYVIGFIFGEFDFGIIFEIASLVFLIIARSYMSKYDESASKRYIIFSIVAIGWILIYDIVALIASVPNVMYITFVGYEYFFGEFFTLLYIMVLFLINKNLSKADNPTKYKETTDWFYERYEEKENEENSRKM